MRRACPAAIPLLAAILLCPVSGCGDAMLWQYRDDPYIAGVAAKGDQEVLRAVNAPSGNERQMALRILADRAGELRRAGRRDEAAAIEEIIIRRYFVEKEPDVRACIVRICASAVGRGSSAMVRFLRDRIAAGEFPGYAAVSLASLGPKGAYEDIAPLTRHPDPEVRLQAATALAALGDPRGYDAVARVWRGMEHSLWPETVDGMSLAEARDGLEARARRGFGKPLGRD